MPRSLRSQVTLAHPDTADLDLLDVLHALADPTRMTIVCALAKDGERACGTFSVDVAPSTLTHHFRVLREAGVIHQRQEGNRRFTNLRENDLKQRFPGLLDRILASYPSPGRGVATSAGTVDHVAS